MSYSTPVTRALDYIVQPGDWNELVNDIRHLRGDDGAISFVESAAFTKSMNGGLTLDLINTNTGTSTLAAMTVRNDTGSTDALRLFCYGKSWTTSGIQVQDGANVEAGSNLSGGLSIGAAHASGVVRIFTGGSGSGNKRAEFDASGNMELVGGALTMTAGNVVMSQGYYLGQSADKNLYFGSGYLALNSTSDINFNIDTDNNGTTSAFYWSKNGNNLGVTELMFLNENGRLYLDFYQCFKEQATTPTDPASGSEVNVYMKSDAIVFQYNDGGTVRYKYLTLSGTGVTWTHSTTPP